MEIKFQALRHSDVFPVTHFPQAGRVVLSRVARDLFQRYNAGIGLVAAYDGVTMVAVAAMARLVPPGGWVARPGKPKDCLHGSPAVPWYNALVLNVLDVVL